MPSTSASIRICSTLSATLRRKSPSSAFAISSASGSLSSVIGVPSAGVQSSNSTIAGPPNDHLIPTPGASANFHHQRGLYRGFDHQIVEGYLSSQPGKDQLIRLEADQAHFVLSGQDPTGDLVEKIAPLPREHAEALFGLCIGQISYDRLHLPPQSGLSYQIQL